MESNQELREKYNPEGSNLRKAQLTMLDMLIYVAKICDRNNLNYWLSSGTLLGAIRHNGFIPWDDDIDIEMPVEDFIKLKKIMRNDQHYLWHDHSTDRHYHTRTAKVRDANSFIEEKMSSTEYKYNGLFIDIFPVEKMPESLLRLSHLLLFKCNGVFSYTNNPLRLFLSDLRYYFGSCVLVPTFRLISKIVLSPNYHHTYGLNFFRKRDIDDVNDMVKVRFENELFNAPRDYDKYLKGLFGENYMSLPPESDRQTHCEY